MPVRRIAERADRLIVGVAGDQHRTRRRLQAPGDPGQQRQGAIGDHRAAGLEEAVALDDDDRAVREVAHLHQPLLDLALQEGREPRHRGRRWRWRWRRWCRRADRRRLGVETLQGREDVVGRVVQRVAEAEIHAEQDQSCQRRHDPHRQAVAQPGDLRRHAFPARRERLFAIDTVAAAQHLRQARAQAFELRLAVVENAVAAFEAEGERHVHQLEQVAIGGHVLGQLGHQLEHLLAAPGLVVEQDQQALPGPDARAAPGRARRRFVEQGAQDVACGNDLLVRQAFGAGLLLELADAVGERVLQPRRVRVLHHGADARRRAEQGRRGRDQRVEAGAHQCVERERRFLAAAGIHPRRAALAGAARGRSTTLTLALGRSARSARLGAATGARLDHRAVRFEGCERIVLASGIAHVVSCQSVAEVERGALRRRVV